jgi:hypothetical protein
MTYLYVSTSCDSVWPLLRPEAWTAVVRVARLSSIGSPVIKRDRVRPSGSPFDKALSTASTKKAKGGSVTPSTLPSNRNPHAGKGSAIVIYEMSCALAFGATNWSGNGTISVTSRLRRQVMPGLRPRTAESPVYTVRPHQSADLLLEHRPPRSRGTGATEAFEQLARELEIGSPLFGIERESRLAAQMCKTGKTYEVLGVGRISTKI